MPMHDLALLVCPVELSRSCWILSIIIPMASRTQPCPCKFPCFPVVNRNITMTVQQPDLGSCVPSVISLEMLH
ncbi:unnamed protein product [Sphagnum compactum]